MTRPESTMLATIKRLRRQLGQSPTRREIAAALGVTPTLGSRHRGHLLALVKQGRIRVQHGVARGIEVV